MPVIGSMLSESMGSFLNLTSTVPSGCLSWGDAAVKTKIIRAENRTRSIDENHSGRLLPVLYVTTQKCGAVSLHSGRTFWTNAKQEDRIVLHTRLIWSTMSIRSPPDQNRQTSGVSATSPLFLFVNCPDLLPRTAKTLSLVCIEHTAQCKVILNSAESKTFFVTVHFSATPHRTPSRADLVWRAF